MSGLAYLPAKRQADSLPDEAARSMLPSTRVSQGKNGPQVVPESSSLNDWLRHKVRPMFESRVLAVSEDVMFRWRLLVEDGRKVGYTFSQPDLIIAATALQHSLTIVTRDTRDYERTRAQLMNPWIKA